MDWLGKTCFLSTQSKQNLCVEEMLRFKLEKDSEELIDFYK